MEPAFTKRIRNDDFEVELNKLDDSQRAAVEAKEENIVITASAGSGKALRNGTKVATINGWKPIEKLTTQDKVAAEDGKFYPVLGVYPQGVKEVYRVMFSDGNSIDCSGDHIWTWQLSDGHWRNSTTEELQLQLNDKHQNIYLPQTKTVKFLEKESPCSAAKRAIQSIEKTTELDEMTCIEVGSPSHLYLTEHLIPTHNTSTLITAIANYRYEHLNDRICAITYTQAATQEMQERLSQLGIRDIQVKTIHGWAHSALKSLAIKYGFDITILQSADIRAILEKIVTDYRLRRNNKIQVNIEILKTFIDGGKNMDITDSYRSVLKALERRYIGYKRDNNLYDHNDYPLYLLDVLKCFDEYIYDVDALFVDELQDVDENQFEVFKRVKSRKKFFIGDAWQSIFIFRNADGAIFEKLENFKRYKLKYNYRSYQEIINYAVKAYEDLKPRILSGGGQSKYYISNIYGPGGTSICCSRGYGGSVDVINTDFRGIVGYHYEKQETSFMNANKCQEKFNLFMSRNPMILCRTNKQVKAIQGFGYSNVGTIHSAKGLEYDNVVVIDTGINSIEDLNIAYVALTRARDNMMVMCWSIFEQLWRNKDKMWFV